MTAATSSDLEQLFIKATQYHQNDNLDNACQLYQEICDALPDSPLVNYNYGLALFQKGHYKQSLEKYKNALQQVPEDTDILYNLALCYKKLENFDETISTYQKILSITPEDIDSHYNLGCCLKDIDADDKAISCFKEALKISGSHQSSINNLAYIYHKNDDFENALKYYKKLLNINPEHEQAKHMVASICGELPQHAPIVYVEQVFDSFSETYDINLIEKLEYRVPTIMRKKFGEISQASTSSFKTLDLGCGTGLGGEAFRDLSSSLTGVDISKKMIQIAHKKGLYDLLTSEDINTFVNKEAKNYNLILAIDVLTYIGDLENIFNAITKCSQPETYFCFSVENSGKTMELRKTGRYAHSKKYIQSQLNHKEWLYVDVMEINLRKEKGEWLKGMVYILQRQNS